MPISYYIQLFVVFLLLCIIFFIVTRFSKFLYNKKYTGEIKMIDRMPLEYGSTLVLVEIRKKTYLVCLSNKGQTIIEKL